MDSNKVKSVDNHRSSVQSTEEDRPIVNNRFKKAQATQAMNESIQSLPKLSARGSHNESRQSLGGSGARRKREDRRKSTGKTSSPKAASPEEHSPVCFAKNSIDDIPIPAASKGQKTFEQMLEEELAKEAGHKKTTENSDMKKSFLKRKVDSTAKKLTNSTAKKNYKYYVDNF